MPNTLGTLAYGKIIQTALDLVFTKRPILRYIGMDVADLDTGANTAKKDQAMTTRILNIPSVGDFGDAASAAGYTDVSITMDSHKQILMTFTTAEVNKSERNLVEETATPFAVALRNWLIDRVATKWTKALFTNESVKAAGWDYEFLVDLRGKLNLRGVPEEGRYLCASTAMYSALLKDPLIVADLNNGANQQAIMSGMLPMVQGFAISEYPECPSAENLVGFAGYKQAVVYAQRVPVMPAEYSRAAYPGNLGVIVEPETQIPVMVNEWIDASTRNVSIRMDWLSGVAVGDARFGERIVTAPA